MSDNSLLLVTHVHLKEGRQGWQIDDQTAASVAQWCRYFDRITYYGLAVGDRGDKNSSSHWVDTNDGVLGRQARFVALPMAYQPAVMARHLQGVRYELARAISAHRHLCFTLGNIVGDWPSLAALEAIIQKRHYAAWIDRVEPHIIRTQLANAPLRRFVAELTMPVTQWALRYLVRHSSVALLQGRDTFDWYAGSAPAPHCTYDTHTVVEDQISSDELAAKQARALASGPLRIVYVGRAAAMKGPFVWIDALAKLHARGVPFTATWIGDGPALAEMRTLADNQGLAERVSFPGFYDRQKVLEALRESDVLLFCHQTPESARCLIEALVCGCGLVGFTSAYPRGLIEKNGGGLFVPQNDISQLVDQITVLHSDRKMLGDLIVSAAQSGQLFNEDSVYEQRALLMGGRRNDAEPSHLW